MPRFSGFYAKSQPVLLAKLGVSRPILAGIAADIRVLFTWCAGRVDAPLAWRRGA